MLSYPDISCSTFSLCLLQNAPIFRIDNIHPVRGKADYQTLFMKTTLLYDGALNEPFGPEGSLGCLTGITHVGNIIPLC